MPVQFSGTISNLFPKRWLWAPWDIWKVDYFGVFVFLGVNLVLGTIGFWTAFGFAWLTGKPTTDVFDELLKQGACYQFVIPFLAATAAMLIEGANDGTTKGVRHTRWLSWALVATLLLVVCALLLPIQLAAPTDAQSRNFATQMIVCALVVIVAIYMFCMLRIDQHGSVVDDVNQGAAAMQNQANTAVADKKAFDSDE
jgi:hypothetical protein